MEPYDVIVNQPVVIDNGSGVIKAGFAGDQVKQQARKLQATLVRNYDRPTHWQGWSVELLA